MNTNIWGKHDKLNSFASEEKTDQFFKKDKWRGGSQKNAPQGYHAEKTDAQGFQGPHGDLVIKSRLEKCASCYMYLALQFRYIYIVQEQEL